MLDLAAGRLAVPEQTELEAHLAGCAVCRDRYEQVRRTWAVLGDWRIPASTCDIWPALQARIAAAEAVAVAGCANRVPTLPVRRRFPAMLKAAAIVLLAVGLGHLAARMSLRDPAQPLQQAALPADRPVADDQVARQLSLQVFDARTPAGLSEMLLTTPGYTFEETTR